MFLPIGTLLIQAFYVYVIINTTNILIFTIVIEWYKWWCFDVEIDADVGIEVLCCCFFYQDGLVDGVVVVVIVVDAGVVVGVVVVVAVVDVMIVSRVVILIVGHLSHGALAVWLKQPKSE